MSTIGAAAVLALLTVAGLALLAGAWMQPAPTLVRTLRHVQRQGNGDRDATNRSTGATRGRVAARALAALANGLRQRPGILPTDVQLRLVGRPIEQHVLYLAIAFLAGLLCPTIVVAALQQAGVLGFGWYAPLVLGVVGAAIGPLLLHSATVERAHTARSDLRYQVSAYLDVVTMLLAGNSGYEGALDQAARAGDGRLFAELRRRMRESGARGASLTDALAHTGSELGLDELEQIASTAALSAAEGAPVARTLAAKCSSLRAAIAAENETEARLRTSRFTAPIVGMALIFMALVIYPALSFS